MPSRVDGLVLRVEALLFASGKPLSVKELTEALDSPDFRPVQQALKHLQRTYDGRQTALEIRRVGTATRSSCARSTSPRRTR